MDETARKNKIKGEKELILSEQDKEFINEAIEFSHANKPAIKDGVMRVVSLIICDLIEKFNTFKDDEQLEKKGALVFLPGYFEIF